MEENNLPLISVKEASKMTPYSPDYLSLLIRKGRLQGYKIGKNWHTTESAVRAYLQRAAESSYDHQQTMEAVNIKVPEIEIRKAAVNFRWAMLLLGVIAVGALFVWKIMDDKKNENVRNKYRISEDNNGNVTIFADDPSQIKSVNVMKKE
jgi:excisionase family DNA binding protein